MALKIKEHRRDSERRSEVLEAVSKEETKRLNLDIPVSLHNEIKRRAIDEGGNIKSVVLNALNEYLSK